MPEAADDPNYKLDVHSSHRIEIPYEIPEACLIKKTWSSDQIYELA